MMRTWVAVPTAWIEDRGLKQFSWTNGGGGSDEVAALVCYILIAHHTDSFGMARLTYDKINLISGLSRAKISRGLDVLVERELIAKEVQQSVLSLSRLDTSVRGWGMLPAKGLYTTTGKISFFQPPHLRSRAELDALKLYLLFVSRRDINRNVVDLSYDKISDYFRHQPEKRSPTPLTLLSVERGLSAANVSAATSTTMPFSKLLPAVLS